MTRVMHAPKCQGCGRFTAGYVRIPVKHPIHPYYDDEYLLCKPCAVARDKEGAR